MKVTVTLELEVPDGTDAHDAARSYFLYQYGDASAAWALIEPADEVAVVEAVEAVVADVVEDAINDTDHDLTGWRIVSTHVKGENR